MELDAEGRVLAMGEGHHLAVGAARGDVERALLVDMDDERVIAARLEGRRQPGEETGAVMLDLGGAAMHRGPGMDDAPAKGLADALVPEADAEDRQLAGEAAHNVDGDPGLGGRAGAFTSSSDKASLRTTLVGAPSSSK